MNKTDKQEFFNKVFDLSLNLLIELPYEEILEAARGVGEYNEFNADVLEAMMRMFDERIPREYYNQNNPNNGKRLYTLHLGREHSMVLYYSIYPYTQRGKDTVNLLKADKSTLQTIAMTVGKADEFDMYEENGYFKIRIWWD